MINNVVHSHKSSNVDISSSKTSSVRHLGNVFEEHTTLDQHQFTNPISHTSNNLSLGSSLNFHPERPGSSQDSVVRVVTANLLPNETSSSQSNQDAKHMINDQS